MPPRKKSRQRSRRKSAHARRTSTRSPNKKFVMFSAKQRKEILKHYHEVVSPKSPNCTTFPLSKILKAAQGMYIYPEPIPSSKGIDEICYSLVKSYREAQHPIVHEDSLTAWGNQAAEQYGLEVRDILKMKPGEQMRVILLDRNVGDYMHGSKKGHKYNPKKDGFSYATYTHEKDLQGSLKMDVLGEAQSFQWEINRYSLKEKKPRFFWGPIPKGMNPRKLNPKIKVGWRGPAIDMKDTKYLPKYFIHYDTWWDDYLPFRTHNFLKIKRIKK